MYKIDADLRRRNRIAHAKYRKTKKGRRATKRRDRKQWLKRKKNYREYCLKRLYNLSLVEYQALLQKQNGLCAICQEPFDLKKPRAVHVDHVHDEIKTVRGLLCPFCNTGLGMFRDSILKLQAAISYLKEHLCE